MKTTTIPVSTTTLPSGTTIIKTLEHTDDTGIGNGYDKLELRKEIKFADNCNNKLKQLGVDSVWFTQDYECPRGSMKPVRKSSFDFAKKGMVSFFSGKGLSKEHLGSFHIASNKDGVKAFLKVLADIKEQGLPLDGKTVRYLMKFVR